MDYSAVKLVHVSAVVVSITGFALRGAASLAGAAWVQGRSARTVPHVVDTVLLASAILLAWMAALNPLEVPWLAAKIIGLLLYIVIGVVALRVQLPWRVRAVAYVAALLCALQIVAIAVTKSTLGVLALAG